MKSRIDDVHPLTASGELEPELVTSQTLCFHAKLAVLCQRYLVEPFKLLCVTNLYHTLLQYRLKQANTNDILDLLYYVYNEDGADDVPEIRELTLLFVVARMTVLREDERLKLIIIENGQLGADLVYKMSEQRPIS